MCIICLEVMNEKMRTYEARLALSEMKHAIPEDHVEDVKQLIDSIEWTKQSKVNQEEGNKE
jgi:hypothetical protein